MKGYRRGAQMLWASARQDCRARARSSGANHTSVAWPSYLARLLRFHGPQHNRMDSLEPRRLRSLTPPKEKLSRKWSARQPLQLIPRSVRVQYRCSLSKKGFQNNSKDYCRTSSNLAKLAKLFVTRCRMSTDSHAPAVTERKFSSTLRVDRCIHAWWLDRAIDGDRTWSEHCKILRGDKVADFLFFLSGERRGEVITN